VAMASSATTKAARRAAREAVVAAQADLARRTRANMDDLAVFLSARQRADAVDDWFNERVAALEAQADERRAGQRRECGVALAAMCERGESIRDIARMAGIGEKTVRELIRVASTGDAGSSASDEAMLAVLNGHTGAQGERSAAQPPGETPAPPTGS
jgi:DNA-binding NarL/FixJ family response regulator